VSAINSVVLVGNLTRDAALKYTSSGLAILEFSLAVNRRVKSGDTWTDEASFFDITLFGKAGESVSQYMTKGKQVSVQGELKQDRWEQDGQKRSKVVIIANDVRLLGGRGPGGGERFSRDSGAQDERDSRGPSGPAAEFEDDIPF